MTNDMTTGRERQIFELPENAWVNGPALDLSPDGKTLALTWLGSISEPGNPQNGTALQVATDGSGFREIFTTNRLTFSRPPRDS